MRGKTLVAAALALFPLLVGPGSAQEERVGLRRSSDGKQLQLEIRDRATVADLLEACAPELDRRLYYDRTQLRERVQPAELTMPRDELWDRLQPLLTVADVVWVPSGEDEILLWNQRTSAGGEISGRAPFVPVGELLDFASTWERRTAMIVTTIVPLRTIDARLTFSSLRQYFTNTLMENLTPIDDANALVMTGSVPLVLSMAKVLEELDTPPPRLERRFRLYAIESGDPEAIAARIDELLTKRYPPSQWPTFRPRDVVLALKDRREVLLHARPDTIALVDELIESLDR